MPHQCSYLTQLKMVSNTMTEAALWGCNIHYSYYLGTTTFHYHCFCFKSQALLPYGNSLQCFHMHSLTHLLCFIKMCNFKHSVFFPSLQQEHSSMNKVMFLVISAQSRYWLNKLLSAELCFSLHVCCEVLQCVTR